MKKLVLVVVALAVNTSVWALSCPVGYEQACQRFVGCKCIPKPPPVCTTAWGTQIVSGTCITLYSEYFAVLPTTCGDIGTAVCCSGTTLTPNITGYPVCTQYGYPDDGGGD